MLLETAAILKDFQFRAPNEPKVSITLKEQSGVLSMDNRHTGDRTEKRQTDVSDAVRQRIYQEIGSDRHGLTGQARPDSMQPTHIDFGDAHALYGNSSMSRPG